MTIFSAIKITLCVVEMTNDVNGDDETENISYLVSNLDVDPSRSLSERSLHRTNPDSTSPRPSPTSNRIVDLNQLSDYPRRDGRFYDRLATYEMFPESCPGTGFPFFEKTQTIQ